MNSFRYATQAEAYEGDAADVYVQLVDASVSDPEYGPEGRRYIPDAGAILAVTLQSSVEDARLVVRYASQPYATAPIDCSIWKIAVTALDALRGTVTMRFELTEGVKKTHWVINGGLRVFSSGVL